MVSHSLHPGAVNTEIYAKGDSFYKIIGWLSRPINLTEEEGAKTTLYAALSEVCFLPLCVVLSSACADVHAFLFVRECGISVYSRLTA